MASEAAGRHDPAARGFGGRILSAEGTPAPGEAPSPGWLAQLGRAPIADGEGGKLVRRLTEDGLAVPGDDPLYQYLGAQRLISAEARALHDEQLARQRAMLDEAREALAELLAEVAAAGAAAEAARRNEDVGVLKRVSAELDERIAAGTRMMRDAMAEERNAMTAAVSVAVAEALARAGAEKTPGAAAGAVRRRLMGRGSGWAAKGRPAALWAAVLGGSLLVGMVLAWMLKH